MTPKQFNALATLLRLRPGPTRCVAHDVLCAGTSVGDAARAHGLTYPSAYKVVQRARRGLELVREAAG